MLGIPDFWVWSAYVLCILSTAACVVYGIYNWNRGGNDEMQEFEEELQWEKAEREVESTL